MNEQGKSQRLATPNATGNVKWPSDEVLHAGLTLIMADAARGHLRAGNLESATSCIQEAERFMALLPRPQALRLAS